MAHWGSRCITKTAKAASFTDLALMPLLVPCRRRWILALHHRILTPALVDKDSLAFDALDPIFSTRRKSPRTKLLSWPHVPNRRLCRRINASPIPKAAASNSHYGIKVFRQQPRDAAGLLLHPSLACCVIAEENGDMERITPYTIGRALGDLQSPEGGQSVC